MSSHVATLYGANIDGVGQRHRLAEVEHVGRGAVALLLVGRVDLVLAGRVGLRRVHLDAVLVLERLDDRAVVGPIRRQRNDVQLALLLGRLDQARPCRRSPRPTWPRRPSLRTRSARPRCSLCGGAHAISPASMRMDAEDAAARRRVREEHIRLEYFIAEPSDGQESGQWRGDYDTGSPR